MFKIGDKVKVTHPTFYGGTGTITQILTYYRITFDRPFRILTGAVHKTALFKEKELEHMHYDNISDVLKDYLFNRGWGKNNE